MDGFLLDVAAIGTNHDVKIGIIVASILNGHRFSHGYLGSHELQEDFGVTTLHYLHTMHEISIVTVKGCCFSPFEKFGTASWKGGLLARMKGGSGAGQGGHFLEKGGSAGEKGGTIRPDGPTANASDKAKC